MRGADGKLLGFSKVTRDLTDRKRAEDEIRGLNEDLERRVRDRTADLAETNRDLGRRNEENEMFVYSVSHDLRSPLVNLQGFSKELERAGHALAAILSDESVPATLRSQGHELLDGKMAKSIRFIQAAVVRLSTIIDALLRLSRAGRVEYRWETVDVSEIVGRVIAAAQATIEERGATVTVGDLPPARGDRTAIEQVFGNLIGNALTYLDPSRPGLIEVGSVAPERKQCPAGFWAYYVRDNGLGIAEAHQRKIFNAFQRAHPGIGSGEGLGLAIVNCAAGRHGGRVWVESQSGQGSAFFVCLPAAPARVREASQN
jgi:signal transduction histidine kinase